MPSVDKSNYIDSLLGAVAHAASERDTRLTKLRLVKFVYLFDLFWAQAEKHTFTKWPWAFVHYGPYCRESTDTIDRAEKLGYLVAESYESKYSDEDFRLYGPGNRITEAEFDKVKNSMPLYVSSHLFSVVKKWGDDTYGLLDYVYFHTGPMINARPGEPLSFSNEEMVDPKRFKPVEMLPLSKKKKAVLREIINKMKSEQVAYAESTALFDEEYLKFISDIAGPETETGIQGTAIIKFKRNADD